MKGLALLGLVALAAGLWRGKRCGCRDSVSDALVFGGLGVAGLSALKLR